MYPSFVLECPYLRPVSLLSLVLLSTLLGGCPDEPGQDTSPDPTYAPVEKPDFQVSPSALDFGQVLLNASMSESLTLSNAGDSALYVYGVELQGGGGAFELVDVLADVTVEPGSFITLEVTFLPEVVQVYGGSLSIRTNDEDLPLATVSVSGEGWRGTDDDGDDVTVEEGDCDDDDATVYPGAPELCDGLDNDCDGEVDEGIDADGDGTSDCVDDDDDGYAEVDGDCDDGNPAQNPGEEETCNGIDDNCDGAVDDSGQFDQDGDGYLSCAGDCNDQDPMINPEGTEVCNGLDDDCDGVVDDGFDQDGDGFTQCDQPEADCNDADDSIYPGATEVCNGLDDNCNGVIDDGFDQDGDGTSDCVDDDGDGVTELEGDCNDQDPGTYPGAEEVCDGVDNNCDGTVDEGQDGDGVGGPDCSDEDGDGYSEDEGDCNDEDSEIHPGAEERCNLIDDNCNGEVDEGTDVDEDGDGFSECDGDCDDQNGGVYPEASEMCDGLDNDCDGQVDDGIPTTPWYPDLDGDLFGTGDTVENCSMPAGYAADAGDCDDTNPSVNPGATEICNGIDDDCDGVIDEDQDGDGDGTPDCQDNDGDGYTEDAGDCDDGDPQTSPGAEEVCNDADDDCDGVADDGLELTAYHQDEDGDLYGGDTVQEACRVPDGYVADGTDCDDGDANINPSVAEVCNGIDDDCDGVIDDGVTEAYYVDGDGDLYGEAGTAGVDACSPPDGYVGNDGDCDDGEVLIHPGAAEICNTIDDNCDGVVDEGFGDCNDSDDDGDGATENEGDCDDTDAEIRPVYVTIDAGSDGTGSVDQPFNTIQEALDTIDPQVCPLILVAAGVYLERIDYVGKSVTVRATAGPDATVIDGEGLGTVVTFAGGETAAAVLDGFTISGGYAEYGGGVRISGASPSLMNDQFVSNYCMEGGGGLYVKGGAVTLEDTLFSGNGCGEGEPCTKSGGAILLSEASATLYGNTFSGNHHPVAGGAIALQTGSDAVIGGSGLGDGNRFEDNQVGTSEVVGTGGAVYVSASILELVGNELVGNQASDAGGAVYAISVTTAGDTQVVMTDNTFTDNSAGPVDLPGADIGLGGAVFGSMATVSMTGNVLTGNRTGYLGGAVYLKGGSVMDIGQNVFDGNQTVHPTDGNAGAVYLASSSGVFSNNTLTGNSSTYNAGAMTVLTCSELTVADNDFVGNFANISGSGLAGGLYAFGSASTISGNRFEGNVSSNGGGALVLHNASDVVLHNVFVGNGSGSRGGAIFVTAFTEPEASVSIQNNLIRGNVVTSGYGGGLCFSNKHSTQDYVSRGVLRNNVLLENDASENGAGAYIGEDAIATVEGNIFYQNRTARGLYVRTGTTSATVLYNDAYENEGGDYGGELSSTLDGSNLTVFPDFAAYSVDGNEGNDDFHLAGSSPLIDAGDPSSSSADPDGSRNDIGMYGGPDGSW